VYNGDPKYFLYDGGLDASYDGGKTWRIVGLPVQVGALAVAQLDGTAILATSPDGLQISRDGGATWSLVFYTYGEPSHVAVDRRNPAIIYASTQTRFFFRARY
jgi:hypothetical protein